MLGRAAVAWVGILLVGSSASGQQWARKMFETTAHDFGSVARGAKAEYEFIFSNIYVEDVHVASVRSSCGCTSVRVKNDSLKTYEQSAIVARLNTPLFLGSRGATITVTFDKPYYAEVQLQVRGYIRSDVVFTPNSVELGELEEGAVLEKKLTVDYAGRNDWRIVDVRSGNPHLHAEAVETRRGGGRVSYELSVRTDGNLPPGYLRDHLVLVTNDRTYTQVPVAVEGRVLSGITVSPASLFMGVVEPGQKVTKKLVVRGSRPFRIVSIESDADCFEFDTTGEDTPKTLHLIPVTFLAGTDPGKVAHRIRIETDLGDEKAPSLSAFAVVTPPNEVAAPAQN